MPVGPEVASIDRIRSAEIFGFSKSGPAIVDPDALVAGIYLLQENLTPVPNSTLATHILPSTTSTKINAGQTGLTKPCNSLR